MTDKERKSCIHTIELLRRLAFNVHGVMDVIDAENCDKIIKMLEADAQQWIPCTSTKRPKNREEVMVTIDNGYRRYTDTDEFVNGQYWYHDNKQVVAWKPFDEPWKGEQK